jgi:hypothetical protein
MDVLAKAQSLVVEHAFTIGICLLIAVLLAGLMWFSMSGNSQKNPALVNKARVNDATTEPESQMPSQEYVEEMAHRGSQEDTSTQQMPDETHSE